MFFLPLYTNRPSSAACLVASLRITVGADVCRAKTLRAAARDRSRASPAFFALLLRWRHSRPLLQSSAPGAMDRRTSPKREISRKPSPPAAQSPPFSRQSHVLLEAARQFLQSRAAL